MKHHANPRFWRCYRRLPQEVRRLADRSYDLLKADPVHRSLHFKKVGQAWSARVGLHYRALAVEAENDLVWFWIGSHTEYDTLVGRKPVNRRIQPTRAKKSGVRRKGRARG